MKEDKREVLTSTEKNKALPTYGYKRVNGKIVLISERPEEAHIAFPNTFRRR